jgi:hypothetical protein
MRLPRFWRRFWYWRRFRRFLNALLADEIKEHGRPDDERFAELKDQARRAAEAVNRMEGK